MGAGALTNPLHGRMARAFCFIFTCHFFVSFQCLQWPRSRIPPLAICRRNHLAVFCIQLPQCLSNRFSQSKTHHLASVFEPRISGLVFQAKVFEFMAVRSAFASPSLFHMAAYRTGRAIPPRPIPPNQLLQADGEECACLLGSSFTISFSGFAFVIATADQHVRRRQPRP